MENDKYYTLQSLPSKSSIASYNSTLLIVVLLIKLYNFKNLFFVKEMHKTTILYQIITFFYTECHMKALCNVII